MIGFGGEQECPVGVAISADGYCDASIIFKEEIVDSAMLQLIRPRGRDANLRWGVKSFDYWIIVVLTSCGMVLDEVPSDFCTPETQFTAHSGSPPFPRHISDYSISKHWKCCRNSIFHQCHFNIHDQFVFAGKLSYLPCPSAASHPLLLSGHVKRTQDLTPPLL